MYAQVKLILILFDARYLYSIAFSILFFQGLNIQNNSSSGFHHPIKIAPNQNFPFPY